MIKKIREKNGFSTYIVQKDEFTIADLNKIIKKEEKEKGDLNWIKRKNWWRNKR